MSLVGQLYKLQQVDIRLQENRQELEKIEKQLSNDEVLVAAESRLNLDREQLVDVRKRQNNSEWELEDIQQKVNKFSKQLYNGINENPKELVNIENEIKSLKKNINKKEDELLAIMSQGEEIEVRVNANSEEFERMKQDWEQSGKVLKKRMTEVKTEVAMLSDNRDELIRQIDSETLWVYEQIKTTKGHAVVRVERGRCQGCHITLPTSQWQRARTGDLVQCTSCSRILYVE